MTKKLPILLAVLFFSLLIILSFIYSDVSFFKYLKAFALVPLFSFVVSLFSQNSFCKISLIIGFCAGIFMNIIFSDSGMCTKLYEVFSVLAGFGVTVVLRFLFEKRKKYKE